MKSRDGKSQREEKSRREKSRREKMQVREKVGVSRNTVFFHRFVAPDGRKGLTTTNLSYRFPIFETSATALCGTTGISTFHYTTQCAWTPYLSFERHETFRECEIASISTMPGMRLVRTLRYLWRSTWTV